MAAMAAAEASVLDKAEKRGREDIHLQESEPNQHKRPRYSLLSEFIFKEDIDSLDTIEDETVLQVMKSLEEEISITHEVPTEKFEVRKIEASDASYEYLVSATDDELGIAPSPKAPFHENDGRHISQNFCNDLFENSSDQKVDLLQPFFSYCYSNNYREFEVYSSDIPDSDGQNWFLDEVYTDSALQECVALFE